MWMANVLCGVGFVDGMKKEDELVECRKEEDKCIVTVGLSTLSW